MHSSTIIAPPAGPPFRGEVASGSSSGDGWDWKKGRPRRNVILAEKTPRQNFIGWEFSVPPPIYPQYTHKDVEAVVHDKSPDMSIVHMFRSQKAKIQEEEVRKKRSDERVREYEQEKARRKAEEAARAAEAARIAEAERRREAERIAREAMRTPEEDQFAALAMALCNNREDEEPDLLDDGKARRGNKTKTNNPFGANSTTSSSKTSKFIVHRPPPSEARSLNDLPASMIRSLEKSHPMVLSQYRANRAKAYLQTAPPPDSPPATRDVEGRSSFRPAGSLTRSASSELYWAAKEAKSKDKMLATAGKSALGLSISGAGGAATGGDAPSASEVELMNELRRVQKQLEDTEKDIERQKLKIALNKKTKNYEKSK